MWQHGAESASSIDLILAGPFLLAAGLYLGGVGIQLRRERAWPWARTLAWLAGIAAAAAGVVGPLAATARQDFVAHMWVHLLAGMVAPLLLVMAAPMTLALRSLDVTPARRLSRLLASPPVRIATVPLVAAVMNMGGLWLLYSTPLHEAIHGSPLAQALVTAHLLVAGYLFVVAIMPVDPAPHRAGYPMRMVVLVLFLAAHSILAKTLYSSPPSGVEAASAQSGAQVMYYAGGLVDAVIILVLCARWYADAGRRLARARAGKAAA